MQKYIKVTGIPTHDTLLIPAYRVKEVTKDGSSPFTTTKVRYLDANGNHDIVTVEFTSTTESAQDIAMANFVKDLIVKVQSTSYTKPYLTVDASDFPQAVTNITGPANI